MSSPSPPPPSSPLKAPRRKSQSGSVYFRFEEIEKLAMNEPALCEHLFEHLKPENGSQTEFENKIYRVVKTATGANLIFENSSKPKSGNGQDYSFRYKKKQEKITAYEVATSIEEMNALARQGYQIFSSSQETVVKAGQNIKGWLFVKKEIL